jgi:hypothetical protein
MVNKPNSEDACSGGPHVDASLIATGITNDNRKFPKIVPLNLILKKAKRCHAVKPSCKTENIHSCEEKSAVRSVGKYSFGNRNYSPHTEDGMQSSRKDRHLSNALRPHVEPDCKRPSIGIFLDTSQLVPTQCYLYKIRNVKYFSFQILEKVSL